MRSCQKLKKAHIFTKTPIVKNLCQLTNKKTFYKKITLFSMFASFELQTSNLPRPPPSLNFIAFLRYKFSKFPKILKFSSKQKMVKWLDKCYFLLGHICYSQKPTHSENSLIFSPSENLYFLLILLTSNSQIFQTFVWLCVR